MVSLIAWLGLPALLCAVAVGVGLLGERLARIKLSNALLAPLGACASVCIVLPVYALGGTVAVAAPLLCLCAVLGLVLGRRGLRKRLRPGWCAIAGAATYAMYIAPVVLSGHWTWLGYNFVNDTANNMLFAAHLAEHGITSPATPPSSSTAMIDSAIGVNYPLGSFALLGTLHRLLGVPVEAVYQPFIALLAAFAAVSLAVLARRLGVASPWAAVLGVAAASASLAYDYALLGAIKEVALVLVLATAAALAREALDAHWRPGALALLGVVLAAGVAVFSGGAGAYAAVLAAVLVLAYLLEAHRPPVRVLLTAGAAGAVAFGVASAATLVDALDFVFGTAEGFSGEGGIHGQNSVMVLGYLARELPVYQALGVWPADDFRFPLAGARWAFTIVAMAIACALIAVAAVSELRRRRLGALLLLGPAAVTFLVAAPRLAPYAEAKLLMVLSPAAVFAAGIGAWRLGRSPRLRVPALAAAGVLAGGILVSNALAYHQARIAPTERLEALEDAAERAPARGSLLLGEWEEFGKYFARSREINTGSESFSPRPVVLRQPVPMFANSFDLDEMALEYVQSFPSLLVRRSPAASRPPSSFGRVYRNEYYEVWRRRPSPAVLEHLSLQEVDDRGAEPRCADVRKLARAAAPGERLVGVPAPEQPRLDVVDHAPRGWNGNGIEGTLTPGSPGDPAATVQVAAGGRYRVWMRGGSGRELTVFVDGRDAGRIQGVNTPDQWLRGSELTLAAGAHELRLVRPGGNLAPGDGYAAEIGPVTLEPVREPEPVTVAPASAQETFCGGRWDWIERIRP